MHRFVGVFDGQTFQSAGRSPKPRQSRQRNVCVFWKDGQFKVAVFPFAKPLDADIKAHLNGSVAATGIFPVKGRVAVFHQPGAEATDSFGE